MATAIANRAGLDAYLQTLRPVPDGHVRVFRGQTTRYDKLLASGHRGAPSKRELLWKVYSPLLAQRMAGTVLTKPEDGYASLADLLYWFEALKQHYGPGSPFIDVSHSLEVGLWFAVHEGQWQESMVTTGTGNTPRVDLFPVVRRWLGYRRSVSPGWLYVLDVPVPRVAPSLKHGTFVDLRAQAPAVFTTSARIQAQQACLVLADADVEGGDLSSFLACEPIEISPAIAGGITGAGNVETVFPSPDHDPWYARFLDIPEWWDTDGKDGLESFLAPALGITLYAPRTQLDASELMRLGDRMYSISPMLTFDYLLRQPETPDAVRGSIGIILEGPITIASFPLASGHWNEEALWRGLATRATVRDPRQRESDQGLKLNNIFFEFSPLERADWDEYATSDSFEMLRGLCLNRVDDGFALTLAQQTAGDDLRLMSGLVVTFDESQKRIVLRAAGESQARLNLADWTPFAKSIFHALLAFHHLSPEPKVAPLPFMVTGNTLLAASQTAVARLEFAYLPCQLATYLRIRNTIDGSLYLGGSCSAGDKTVVLPHDRPFGAIPYPELLRAFENA